MNDLRTVPLIAVVLLIAGCSIFGDEKDETAQWSEDRLYTEAKGALDSEYFPKAVEHYERLQSRYPFGKFSKQAQLDLAYAYYKTDEPDAAIGACNRFIKLNPDNPHVDYAYYLKGLANFNQGKGLTQRYLPTDGSQRDPGASMQAFQGIHHLDQTFSGQPIRTRCATAHGLSAQYLGPARGQCRQLLHAPEAPMWRPQTEPAMWWKTINKPLPCRRRLRDGEGLQGVAIKRSSRRCATGVTAQFPQPSEGREVEEIVVVE